MGSSLVLTGGAAVTKTLKEAITQIGHGFTVGSVIRWDSVSSPPKYVLAVADSAQNAEVAGVVNLRSDADNFEVTYHGYIDLPQFSGISAPVLFLSSEQGGSLGINPPSAVGTVIKPVLTRNTNSSGHLVMNYLGTQIGGSSTISVDEIQPVGTITPFAGTAIPDTWLACDGNSYAISEYPELYQKLCYTTGVRAPIYGHVVDISLSSGSPAIHAAAQVGDYIFIKNHNNASGSLPAISSTPWGTSDGTDIASHENTWDLVGLVIAKGTGHDGGQYGVQVQILPKWTSTGPSGTRRFVMPNAFVQPLNSNTSANAASSTVLFFGLNAAQTAYVSRGIGNINTAKVLAFTVPDLSGRFPVGVMNANSESASGESDNPIIHITSQNGPIELGAMGGEDRHQLTLAEMPAHTHTYKDFGGTATTTTADLVSNASGQYTEQPTSSAGNNAAHNNMPPYLAVRYIIKAKPYTRAAIVDGIDLPYNNLLVRDLRSRNVGGANGDLAFHTNTSGDSGNGTERMRLTTDGKLGISNTTPLARLSVGSGDYASMADYCADFSADSNDGGRGGVLFSQNSSNAFKVWAQGTGNPSASSNLLYLDLINRSTGLTVDARTDPMVTIRGNGWVGLNTNGAPQSTLDVNGTLKVGDFGGTTNVMTKPARVASGGVGQIVPLMTWSSAFSSSSYEVMTQTTPLHEGTWYVYFTGNTDSGIESENVSCVMSHVWTVPASKWLTFATSATFSGTGTSQITPVTSNADSGVWYKIHDSLGNLRTTTVAPSTVTVTGGWTSLNSSTAYTLATQNAQDDSKIGFVYSNTWRMPVNLMGYAIRIA